MSSLTVPHIAVLDSGVGGLSVIHHIRQCLPHVGITFLMDNARFPYGLLEPSYLSRRVLELLQEVCQQYRPTMIVIACNSASTVTLPALRMALDIPVVGVVPAIKPASLLTNSHVMGLLGTPGTVQRDYVNQLADQFAHHCTIIRVGSAKLVMMVEKTMRGIQYDTDDFAAILASFDQHPCSDKLDTIVLGCTHFPLIQTALAHAAPHIAYWIDSGEAIARRVETIWNQQQCSWSGCTQNRVIVTSDTGDLAVNESLIENLRMYGFDQVHLLESVA